MKPYQRYILSIITGLLLSLAWSELSAGLVLLIALIPLFFVEEFFYQNKLQYSSIRVFNHAYIAFLTWNIASTWWIYYASFFGAVGAVVCNSFLYAFVFWQFHITKRKLGYSAGYISLMVFWCAFEYLHFNWDFDWPWLILGNGFSHNIKIIQWYEFTGTLGGSLWALFINILLFRTYLYYKENQLKFSKKILFWLITTIGLIIIPITFSLIRYFTYSETVNPVNIVVTQPNIDPYNDKFSSMDVAEQLDIMLNLANSVGDSKTDFFVAPETVIPYNIWEEKLSESDDIKYIIPFLRKFYNSEFVLGASTLKEYKQGETVPASARSFSDTAIFYDSYNTALMLDTNNIQIYHKSRLVTGVEKIPYPEYLNFLSSLAVDLGGSTGTLGRQANRIPFVSKKKNIKIAPVICYESLFGEFVSEYVKNGANLIFVITNDGWWEDTPGYKQHLTYSCLRAIETRRSIARSANTGISCFINQRGDIIQATKWWKQAVIKGQINANSQITFYVEFGDYIGRISAFIAVLLFLYRLVVGFRKKYS
ncbi:MAG: apolipoprotein N-acyltransferase [Bacteroidetes bacterium GWA2_30_7]|nr:MAG: apolipoprotein N-acyltransferase [Bacteroidetes bacterium GWA2_30_7]